MKFTDMTGIDGMISSEDPSRRRKAATLLAEAGGDAALDRLELLLRDGNSGVRDAAQSAIVLLGSRAAVEKMLPLLSDEDPSVRNTAIDILRKIGIDGVDLLHAHAKDADDNVRMFILDILGTIGIHESVDILIEGLYDVNPNVRNAAVISLGELGDPRAFDHLKQLINDEEWIRFSVIESLARIPHEQAVDFLLDELKRWSNDGITVCAILETLAAIGSREAVRPLMDILEGSDQYVRFAAVRTLLAIMSGDDIAALDPESLQLVRNVLESYLPEAEGEHLYRVLEVLGRIGDEESSMRIVGLSGGVERDIETDKWDAIRSALESLGNVGLMVTLLDADEKSAILGAEVLGSIGGEREAREIAARISTRNGYGKRVMADALARIGGKGLRQTMLRLIGDEDGHVVGSALKALGEIGCPDDIGEIRKFLQHPYPDVRSSALETIARIGSEKAEECFTELAGDADPNVRIMALEGLLRMRSSRLGHVSSYLLKDPSWEVRTAAVNIIRDAGLPLEDDLLVALLNDERDEIRRPAIDIVGMRRVQNLRSFLVDAIDSEEMWTAFHAVEALGRFRDDDAKTRLLSILERGPDFLRISAAKALGEWEDEALAAELEVYLDDENIDVARAAAEAIDSLHGGAF